MILGADPKHVFQLDTNLSLSLSLCLSPSLRLSLSLVLDLASILVSALVLVLVLVLALGLARCPESRMFSKFKSQHIQKHTKHLCARLWALGSGF